MGDIKLPTSYTNLVAPENLDGYAGVDALDSMDIRPDEKPADWVKRVLAAAKKARRHE